MKVKQLQGGVQKGNTLTHQNRIISSTHYFYLSFCKFFVSQFLSAVIYKNTIRNKSSTSEK